MFFRMYYFVYYGKIRWNPSFVAQFLILEVCVSKNKDSNDFFKKSYNNFLLNIFSNGIVVYYRKTHESPNSVDYF